MTPTIVIIVDLSFFLLFTQILLPFLCCENPFKLSRIKFPAFLVFLAMEKLFLAVLISSEKKSSLSCSSCLAKCEEFLEKFINVKCQIFAERVSTAAHMNAFRAGYVELTFDILPSCSTNSLEK